MGSDPRSYGILITTTGNREDAANIAKRLISDRLAACVQIVPIESYYMWKSEVVNEAELLLLIKTKMALFDEAIRTIKSIHPYETPEIAGTDFVAGFAGYFSWIDEVTR